MTGCYSSSQPATLSKLRWQAVVGWGWEPTHRAESGIFFKWLSSWCWYIMKLGPKREGYSIQGASCKSVTMLLQILWLNVEAAELQRDLSAQVLHSSSTSTARRTRYLLSTAQEQDWQTLLDLVWLCKTKQVLQSLTLLLLGPLEGVALLVSSPSCCVLNQS